METATQILVIVFFGQALANTLDDCNKCSKTDLRKCVVNYNKNKEYVKGDESCSELTKMRECVERFESTCGCTNLFQTVVEDPYHFWLQESDCGFNGIAEQESRMCYKKLYLGENSTCPEIEKLHKCVHAIVPVTKYDINYLWGVTGNVDRLKNYKCSTIGKEYSVCFKKHSVGESSTCPEVKKLETCVHAIAPGTDNNDRHYFGVNIGNVDILKRKFGC